MNMEVNRNPSHGCNNPSIPADLDNAGNSGFSADPVDHSAWNWESAWIDLGGEG